MTKLTHKPVSEVRKANKAKRRAKLEKRSKAQVKTDSISLAKTRMAQLEKDRRTQELIAATQTPVERFVQQVKLLDQSLVETINAIQYVSTFRNRIKWDLAKTQLDDEQRNPLEEAIVKLETLNNAWDEKFTAYVATATEAIEQVKLNVTAETVDEFDNNIVSQAFTMFGEWNDEVMFQYADVHDLIIDLEIPSA